MDHHISSVTMPGVAKEDAPSGVSSRLEAAGRVPKSGVSKSSTRTSQSIPSGKPSKAVQAKAGASKSKRTSKPKRAEKPMAKSSPKKSTGVNKSEEIRKVATAIKAKGEKPRPSVIVAELLKSKGVKVAPAQVSMILKKMGFRPLRKRKKAGAASATSAAAKVSIKSAGKAPAKPAAISVEDLIAAKKMAGNLGGTEKAIAALQALKRFED